MTAAAALREPDFAAALHALLPRGLAWPREPETVQARVVAGLSAIVAALHARAGDLSEREADPSQAFDLLPDWERAFGLPDPCVGEGQTMQDRRAALLARIASGGGQSRAYFIAVAAALGYDVTIEEFRPFVAGDRAGDPCRDSSWRFTWLVRAPAATVTVFRAGQSAAGEPLRAWGNARLECVLGRLRPAHSNLLFGYGD
jgi:uncharacterized protein YmfQ (DUF2313 family)